MLGHVMRLQPGIGGCDRVDPGEPQVFGQPALQRGEHPLGTPARLVETPASPRALGNRPCNVENPRSERPRACGEYAAICSIPRCDKARPTWVCCVFETFSPAFGV